MGRIKIIHAYPPMIDEIDNVFHVRGKPVLFAWADGNQNIVYAPHSRWISEALQAHELMHCNRQRAYTGGVKSWWQRYIIDEVFRLIEEVMAHRAEYQWHRAHDGSRNARRRALTFVAKRLAAPLYGNLITVAQAKKLIIDDLRMNEELARKTRHRLAEWAESGKSQPRGTLDAL